MHRTIILTCIFASRSEDRLRLGSKNKQAYFVLLSTCTTLLKAKIGCASEIKMNKFILYFSRLALSLRHKYKKNA